MRPTAVLFDLDDTLFDHQHGTREALAVLRRRHPCLQRWSVGDLAARHSLLLERLHVEVLAGQLTVDEARHHRFSTLFADAGEVLSSDSAASISAEYRDAYVAAWRLVAGALDLLTVLRGRARVGIVTNNIVREQTAKIVSLGIAPLVDAIVISEAVGVHKPDPRIFELTLERLGCAAVQAVMVGDSWATDIEGARSAGLSAVWFNPDGHPRPDGHPCPAGVRVPVLTSLAPAEHAAVVILRIGEGVASGMGP
jgi:YjjG family noncanonical pyrimidine nucleotidase